MSLCLVSESASEWREEQHCVGVFSFAAECILAPPPLSSAVSVKFKSELCCWCFIREFPQESGNGRKTFPKSSVFPQVLYREAEAIFQECCAKQYCTSLCFLGVFSEKCSPAEFGLRKSVGEVPTRRRKQTKPKRVEEKEKDCRFLLACCSVRWPGKPPKTKTTTGWCFCSHPSYLAAECCVE